MSSRNQFTAIQGIHGEIQRRSGVPDVVMTETRYTPGTSLHSHTHELGCFGFILQGEYAEAFRPLELVCGPQTVVFRPPLIEHRNFIGKEGAHALFLEVSDCWLNHVREYCQILDRPMLVQSVHTSRLASAIYRQWNKGAEGAQLAIEGLLYEIAADLCRLVDKSSERRPKWLDKVLELMHTRFKEPLRLSEIADEVGYHPVHVARVFRRHYGASTVDFIRQLRINFARESLNRTDMPLVEIGLSAGFPSQAYFSTTFKHETGLTPGQYRRSCQQRR